MIPTTVISVRGRDRDELLSAHAFRYVGRPVFRGPHRWKGSPWADPFKVGMARPAAIHLLGRDVDTLPRADTLDAGLAVKFFRVWIMGQADLMAGLPELRGKVLGCFCCDWQPGERIVRPCHAIVLAQLADSMEVIHRA